MVPRLWATDPFRAEGYRLAADLAADESVPGGERKLKVESGRHWEFSE